MQPLARSAGRCSKQLTALHAGAITGLGIAMASSKDIDDAHQPFRPKPFVSRPCVCLIGALKHLQFPHS
ncbi:hypothetical protein, partial [Xanthomonas fragariae]|uniref:hypothetical protein n=1 Tax=Xanthomonas fragariae TaxID=48664 RepID=UPI00387ED9E8